MKLEPKNSEINEANLLTKIWFYPKNTLDYILRNCPEKYITILFILAGIAKSIDRAMQKERGDDTNVITLLILAIIMGALFGWITYHIYAWALNLTGEWIEGKASVSNFKTIIAWSSIPYICAAFLIVPQLIIFGEAIFKSNFETSSAFMDYLYIGFKVLEVILAIWSFVILVIGTKIIQQFNTGKAILNLILPLALILILILIIFLVAGLFG